MALGMLVLVSYDVAVTMHGGARRLRRVAKACRDYGQRVQFSMFEIEVAPDQWTVLRARLLREMDPEHDSLRFYHLGRKDNARIEHVGCKSIPDLDAPLIV